MTEMRRFVKAVEVSGGAVKRWLTMGPCREKDDQQEEVVEPKTPIQQEVDYVSPPDHRDDCNAPERQNDHELLLSTPAPDASQDEEPQTPSKLQASASHRRPSLETDIASPLKATADIELSAASQDIKNPALVSITFNSPGELHTATVPVSLDATSDDLMHLIADQCARERQRKAPFMRKLKAKNQGVHMEAHIVFDDHRDQYVNKDQFGKSRFATVNDMFASKDLSYSSRKDKHPKIPVLVTVRVITLTPAETTPQPPPPDWKYHRVATIPFTHPPISNSSPHSPFRHGFFARYDRTAYLSSSTSHPEIFGHMVELHEREINGEIIGCVDRMVPYTNKKERKHFEKGYQDEPTLAKMTINRNVHFNAMMGREEKNVPRLPGMNFGDWKPDFDADQMENGDIHLAVRCVNALESIGLGKVQFPADVLMTVQPGKYTVSAIHDALFRALITFSQEENRQHACESKKASSVAQLFWGEVRERYRDFVPPYEIELWVLPQRSERKNGKDGKENEGKGKEKGKLYRYEKGSLKWFLDPECVKEGNGKLYVEAWFVPRDGAVEESEDEEDD